MKLFSGELPQNIISELVPLKHQVVDGFRDACKYRVIKYAETSIKVKVIELLANYSFVDISIKNIVIKKMCPCEMKASGTTTVKDD